MGRSVMNKVSSSALVCGLDEKEASKALTVTRSARVRTVAVQREHSTGDTTVSAESFTELYHIIKDKQDSSKWLKHCLVSGMLAINVC